ncbi:hypothetical protein [Streptomyces sirii]|uniref:hypothetical protein n=1 Tax=Streptomyces sirii TaxID=3127701 RepID=UPI003D35A939
MADYNDRTQIPGQRPEFPAPGQHLPTNDIPTIPSPATVKEPSPRLAALREWWDEAWADGGVLHNRWEDLRQAPMLGWHQMANWVKTLLTLCAVSVVAMLLDSATEVLADAVYRLLIAAPRVQIGTDTSTGVWAVLDAPIRSYIAQHSAGLAISSSTIYTLWQLAGLFGLFGGFFRSTAARLTWTAWGAASVAMVWCAAPASGRTVAAGIAALAWTFASAFALRGLSLRPALFIHNTAPEIRPEIRLPAPADPPADDTPHNVHQLQR